MNQIIRIDDVSIRQDAHGRYCLNDLHRAAGGEGKHQPSNFLRLDTTQGLIKELHSSDLRSAPVDVINGGPERGTYVCRELVYAYAMWVSPAFHLKVIRTFDAVVKGQPQEEPVPPGPKAPLTYVEALQRVIELQQQLLESGTARQSPPVYEAAFRPDGEVARASSFKARVARVDRTWLLSIRTWLEQHPGLEEVTAMQLLVAGQGIREPTNVQRSAVGRCMRALGSSRGRRRWAGELYWVYVRPGVAA